MSQSNVDVLIVGAGPAGVAAALAWQARGNNVVLVDEQDAVGGAMRWSLQPGIEGFETGMAWAADAAHRIDAAGVDLRLRTVVWGLFPDNVVALATDDVSATIQAATVIVATGGTDRVAPFPGWDLPGVMTATALRRMLHLQRVLPGERVAIVGSGWQADAVASELQQCGATLIVRAETAQVISVIGDDCVRSVKLRGEADPVDVDVVVVAMGMQPDPELALQRSATTHWNAATQAPLPQRGLHGVTSVAGVHVCGAAAGASTPALAAADGAATVNDSAADIWQPAPIFAEVDTDDVVLCRCEQVAAGMIRLALREGATTLNDVKRRARAGMGLCQGCYCMPSVTRLLLDESGVDPETIVPMTARPPARAVPLRSMARMYE